MKGYPFESHFLELQCGHRMHYLDEGSGPILLMLHGNPTWSFYFRNLVLGLRDHFRCIVPDHVGCGLSDKPANWSYGIRDHTDNVAELLTTLNVRDVTLMVHDWGGAIGYLAAIRSPDLFVRFITFNTAVSLLPMPRILTMLRSSFLGSLVIRGLNGMVWAGLLSSAVHGHRFDRDVWTGYLAPYDSWAHRIALLRFVQEIPLEAHHPNRVLLDELASRLGQFTHLPHLVVWGLKDPIFHRGYLSAWRRQFPGAEVHEIAGASHWVVEEAHERILSLVQEFLTHTDFHIT